MFFTKYLKYKNKYLALKKIIGGCDIDATCPRNGIQKCKICEKMICEECFANHNQTHPLDLHPNREVESVILNKSNRLIDMALLQKSFIQFLLPDECVAVMAVSDQNFDLLDDKITSEMEEGIEIANQIRDRFIRQWCEPNVSFPGFNELEYISTVPMRIDDWGYNHSNSLDCIRIGNKYFILVVFFEHCILHCLDDRRYTESVVYTSQHNPPIFACFYPKNTMGNYLILFVKFKHGGVSIFLKNMDDNLDFIKTIDKHGNWTPIVLPDGLPGLAPPSGNGEAFVINFDNDDDDDNFNFKSVGETKYRWILGKQKTNERQLLEKFCGRPFYVSNCLEDKLTGQILGIWDDGDGENVIGPYDDPVDIECNKSYTGEPFYKTVKINPLEDTCSIIGASATIYGLVILVAEEFDGRFEDRNFSYHMYFAPRDE